MSASFLASAGTRAVDKPVAESPLKRALHRAFIKRSSEDSESYAFAISEHLRMSGVYWGLSALYLVDGLGDMDRGMIVDFVMSCQHEGGGFGGNVGHDPHLLYTLSAVQILVIFDALDRLDETAVLRYVASLQQADGSFYGDEWGEVDTRFSCVRRGQSGRRGGATAGHRRLLRLHLKAWWRPPHSCGRDWRL